jgi:phage tail-like protein
VSTSSEDAPLGGDVAISSRFLLEVDGVEIGVFLHVSGLRLDVDVEDFHEGGENAFVHKFPGQMRWPHLVFRRGLTNSDALFTWVNETSGTGFAANKDTLTRHTGAVTVIDSQGNRLRTWEFDQMFPIRWSGPDFTAGNSEALEEELEVAHHGFRSRKP